MIKIIDIEGIIKKEIMNGRSNAEKTYSGVPFIVIIRKVNGSYVCLYETVHDNNAKSSKETLP